MASRSGRLACTGYYSVIMSANKNGLPISKSFTELVLFKNEHIMAVNVNTVITSRDILEGSSDSILCASARC
jgi:hypothetical protein